MINKVEVELNALPSLEMKGFEKKKENVDNFVKNFITQYKDQYYTVQVDGNITTSPGKRRSLSDIYRITKHYYPNVKLRRIMKIITKNCYENKINVIWCPDIKKRVFKKNQVFDDSDIFFKHIPSERIHRYNGPKGFGYDELGFVEDDYLNLIK